MTAEQLESEPLLLGPIQVTLGDARFLTSIPERALAFGSGVASLACLEAQQRIAGHKVKVRCISHLLGFEIFRHRDRGGEVGTANPSRRQTRDALME